MTLTVPTQPSGLPAAVGKAKHAHSSGFPVVDGKGFLALEQKNQHPPLEVAEQIAYAGKTVGTFQLINHGVDQALIDRMERSMKHFFSLPEEIKLKIERTKENSYGYVRNELTKQTLDLKECFDFGAVYDPSRPHILGLHTPNQWPEGEDEFAEAMTAYLNEMSRVGFKLLEAFSLGLGLPAFALHPVFEGTHTTMMRLNYYPARAPDEKALALNEHTDAGFLTILLQDSEVEGLEVEVNGVWAKAPPLPNSFTINFGDIAALLSNDTYLPANHRVIAPKNGKPRFSAPVFFNPRVDAILEPLPDFVTPEKPAAYRPVSWEEYFGLRVIGNYDDYGEEVQLYHYRT